jgi:thiol-disulfide isomerase/thioredoxin
MRRHKFFLLLLLAMFLGGRAWAQQSQPSSAAPPAKAPGKKPPPASQSTPKSEDDKPAAESQSVAIDSDTELQITVREAGNDSAALVRNLERYLAKYPDTPRRAAIYRGLLESEMQLHNQKTALEYAEKIIAIQPEDSQSMFLAVTILEKMPEEASQLRAIDYDTRLIDRVTKADPESRPQQMTLEDWQAGRNKFMMDLYVLRGRMQHHLHKNEEAVKDLTAGFRLVPNANAALTLGEIAEEGKHADEAVRQYAIAFMLAGQEQQDSEEASLNRESLRLRMGNLWRFTHDSNVGLGDILLSSYDHSRDIAKANGPDAPVYNKDVTDPLQFSLRRIDGSGALKLAESHGKVVVLNFWTTWCGYCNTMESLLAGIRTKFAGRDDVVFLTVNTDEEESLVAPFLQDQKPGGALVFADGINQAFHVEAIPTILVLDKAGKVAYRTQGFAPDGFADFVGAAITKASAAPAP